MISNMRSLTIRRVLRAGSGRWSIAAPRRSLSTPPLLYRPSVRRDWSSTAALGNSAAKTPVFNPSRSFKDYLEIEGQSFRTDGWTTATDTILSHIGRRLYLDENHPLAITRKLIEDQFPSPTYGKYSETNPVVSTTDNFDFLGFPLDHPGRSRTGTYYINHTTLLRTHTSAHQQKYFQQMRRNESSRPEERGYTLVADVYRRDAVDRRHYSVFHQMEGAILWKRPDQEPLKHPAETAATIMNDVNSLPSHNVVVEDGDPTIHPERNPLQSEHHSVEEVEAVAAHLKRSLENMVIKIFNEASKAAAAAGEAAPAETEPLKLRWVEAYFPFTSPSWELEVFWQGDWLELLGCGVIKQDLLISSDVPNRIGWAFGLGLERIAMLLFNIPDIRLFWSRDERFLSQFRAGEITRFKPFSKYPACYKDVSFWLPSASPAAAAGGAAPLHPNDVMEIVREVGGPLAEDVKLIDEFTHPKTHRKSMCYRINYQSMETTLTNEEANEVHDRIRDRLASQLGVDLR